jgi:DNA-binding NarL/FixJ family response regulator
MTVYVIDDHPLMRDALTMLIHRVRPGLKVVPIPKMNLLDTAVEKNGPAELFCLDLQLPDTLGLSGLHTIRAKHPGVSLAVVTSSDASVRIPLMADSDSTFIADSIPSDGGHPALVS